MGWVRINSIKRFPTTKGLYAIYSNDNQLLYIGRSSNLYRRFFNYGDRNVGLSVIRIESNTEDLYFKYKITEDLYMEELLIKRLKPRFNKRYKSVCKQQRHQKGRVLSYRHKNEYFV